jgi:hypothetical protein
MPTAIAIATEVLRKVCSRVQPIKSSCMVLLDTALELVEVIRAMVPVLKGTSTLGVPLTMDFYMTNGPPASHKDNCLHSWLQNSVVRGGSIEGWSVAGMVTEL